MTAERTARLNEKKGESEDLALQRAQVRLFLVILARLGLNGCQALEKVGARTIS